MITILLVIIILLLIPGFRTRHLLANATIAG
jgi:hypothetical protein